MEKKISCIKQLGRSKGDRGKNTHRYIPTLFLSSCSYLFFYQQKEGKDIHEVSEKVRVTKDDITHFKALMIQFHQPTMKTAC